MACTRRAIAASCFTYALVGLDGVLIGLRSRELLQQLLEARCRLSPVMMLIEDLHWIDSVSEELLNKIIDSEAKLRLLVVTTRRPEYVPSWLDRSVVAKLHLEALPAGDIRRLVLNTSLSRRRSTASRASIHASPMSSTIWY